MDPRRKSAHQRTPFCAFCNIDVFFSSCCYLSFERLLQQPQLNCLQRAWGLFLWVFLLPEHILSSPKPTLGKLLPARRERENTLYSLQSFVIALPHPCRTLPPDVASLAHCQPCLVSMNQPTNFQEYPPSAVRLCLQSLSQ